MRTSITKVSLECSPDAARQVSGEHYHKKCFHENVDGVYIHTHAGTTQRFIFLPFIKFILENVDGVQINTHAGTTQCIILFCMFPRCFAPGHGGTLLGRRCTRTVYSRSIFFLSCNDRYNGVYDAEIPRKGYTGMFPRCSAPGHGGTLL
jgi:hypothetical protein